MKKLTFFHSLVAIRSDRTGGTLVEFALLAPAMITALIGVVQVGAWVQNYNAVRNLAGDVSRFAAVEYQRGNQISAAQIGDFAEARAVSGAYNLNEERLTVQVNEVTSRITGAKEMDLDIIYLAPDWLPIGTGDAMRLDYSRPVFLMDTPTASGT